MIKEIIIDEIKAIKKHLVNLKGIALKKFPKFIAAWEHPAYLHISRLS